MKSWFASGRVNVVLGGESRLVNVNADCATDGSCCPSLSTASAWIVKGPPFCGAGNEYDQLVDVADGADSVARFCATTFSHADVVWFHHSPAFTSWIVTSTWSTLSSSEAVPVTSWLPFGFVTVAPFAGVEMVVCGGPLAATPPTPNAYRNVAFAMNTIPPEIAADP